MLSPKIQGAIHSIYGFVRFADEVVDSFHDYDQQLLLHEFEVDLKKAIERRISLNPILNSFQSVYHKYDIGYELIAAFMDSMRTDLNKQSYETMEEYKTYIYGSADVVGLMCLKIFVGGDQNRYEELKYPAMKLGSAFQKVNFLRDLQYDSDSLDRTYFPQLSVHKLDDTIKMEIIADIERDFVDAYVGIQKLPLEAKFGVYTAYVYYRELLNKLRKTHIDKLRSGRIRINDTLKLILLARSFFNYKLNLI